MTYKQLYKYELTSIYTNYELLKIFKAIDVPLFKQGFNLEINND